MRVVRREALQPDGRPRRARVDELDRGARADEINAPDIVKDVISPKMLGGASQIVIKIRVKCNGKQNKTHPEKSAD